MTVWQQKEGECAPEHEFNHAMLIIHLTNRMTSNHIDTIDMWKPNIIEYRWIAKFNDNNTYLVI